MATRDDEADEVDYDSEPELDPSEALELARVESLIELTLKAKLWWEAHRPLSYSLDNHLADPTVNLHTKEEKNLALTIANMVKLGG
jgi:hypothetical protein